MIKEAFSRSSHNHHVWGINLIVISENNYRLEYLHYCGIGRESKGTTIVHRQKYYDLKQLSDWCKSYGISHKTLINES